MSMSRISIQRLAQLRGASSAWCASTRLVGPSGTRPTTRDGIRRTSTAAAALAGLQSRRLFVSTAQRRNEAEDEEDTGSYSEADHEHAVISTFDLFSIGIGPSSSHTVGPMRAGNIFVADLAEANLLHKVNKIRVSIYGSLALTGEGHMTPSALLLGLESADVETVDTAYVPERFAEIKNTKKLFLGQGLGGKGKEVAFDYERDFVWEWGRKLPMHSNGMRFTVFDEEGYVLATNDMFSVGGGFVVNGALSINPDATPSSSSSATQSESPDGSAESSTGKHPADLAENMFYKEIRRSDAAGDRRTGAEVKPLEEAKDDTMLLEGAQDGLPPVASTSTGTGIGDAESGEASESETSGPRYPFRDATSLLALCRKHNLTIAQVVYENEKSHGYTDEEIYHKLFKIWQVMDTSILESVQAPLDAKLPGSLKLHRRAPALYRRLTRGLYSTAGHTSPNPLDNGAGDKASSSLPGASSGASVPAALNKSKGQGLSIGRRQPPRIIGSLDHPITPSPARRTTFPTMDYLTVYAIAVNETNAAGGRIVTAPTNGAAGIIPAVLKYTIEFISDDPERDIPTFLLTAAAIGMLYKRGATISAAEGGCMAEVGVACSMAAGAFAACMGASPEAIEQAAEIGIEHNLGLTCDPIGGLVQAPCIERNALGAIKAISSANLALSSETGTQKVRLDDAIRAMRLTAKGMRNEFKETSLSGLATSVPFNIPVSVPDC
ncbi:L-serine ammonia-lyase [Colletotrichum graminicola M1.001]|uniref:L-serine ammonia-lyase n=1 Tax=Colletotrichum graminicola (strain M1.001 / M2 / FGSC 10212) TaxID=645133 RepID=E3QHW8_COLGM|nr:L-serine ammonia-lyase [Colletotrichum graminicola M1.001]EFQ30456.1 L-serine ammonia-lyase [Colletotrichum graminicola M1.001]